MHPGVSQILLGIDPGLTRTGWGVIQAAGSKLRYIDGGKIASRPADRMGARLKLIYDELQRIASEYQVERCAVESSFVGKSMQSALKLGQARAAAVLALEQMGVEVMDISPREVKLSVTGRGGAAKEQVMYVVGQMLRLEFDRGEEDISDALAIAICLALRRSRRTIMQAAG